MSSKKLLSDLMERVDTESALKESGGKWSTFQCVMAALACAAGPLCGSYSPEICNPGGLLEKNCS